jgi:hypothetical protein
MAAKEATMIELTEEQRQAVMSGEIARVQPAEIGKIVVVLLEEQYEKLQALLEDERKDRIVQNGWQKLAYRGLALSLDDEP